MMKEKSDSRPNRRFKHIIFNIISGIMSMWPIVMLLLLSCFESTKSWATYFTDYSVGHHNVYGRDRMINEKQKKSIIIRNGEKKCRYRRANNSKKC